MITPDGDGGKQPCTIYTLDNYGRVCKQEDVRLSRYKVEPKSAQYTDVPFVMFYKKRKRRACYYEMGWPPSRYILVLAGKGHPDPEWHPSYDMRQFDAMISDYIDATGAKVLVDYRFYVYDEAVAKHADHLNENLAEFFTTNAE